MMKRPNIYEYSDFRKYLIDFMEFKRSTDGPYSYRQFARDAGYVTSDHFQRIVKGKRNLTREGVKRFSKVFKLKAFESKFLELLANFNQAKTHEMKTKHLESLLRIPPVRNYNPLLEKKYKYYSHWYYVAIRELALLPNFQEDPEWIASKLRPRLPIPMVVEALLVLQELKILKRDSEGRLVSAVGREIDMGAEVFSTTMINFHQEMIEQAKESIERFDREKRNISSVTFPIDYSSIPHIKKMINDFQSKLLKEVKGLKGQQSIFQFNLQLFPLSG